MSRGEEFDQERMKSGGDAKNGERFWRLARPTQMALPFNGWEGIAEGPAEAVEHEQGWGGALPTGRRAPLTHVYRGMSHEEWAGAQKSGFIQSDGRQAIIPEWEGTNAAHQRDTAETYVRTTKGTREAGGVVAKIAVHPDEHWFTAQPDSYLRTRHPIPVSRVLSTQFVPGETS